ncbi:MAG: hypothetical protein K2I93_05760, partial [Oscillospiraceae bacterium]|nr:hypothetical protein [Oscillospiraceae bacterium]
MKKMLAHVATLLLSAAMMSGAAVSASAYQSIVIGTNDTGVLLSDHVYCYYDAEYGDIIDITSSDDEIMILETFPGQFANYEKLTFSCVGNVTTSDAYERKEVTVTAASDTALTLEDVDGVIYKYTSADIMLEDFSVPEGMAVSDYQVGDTMTIVVYTTVMYGNSKHVLPLTPAPEHVSSDKASSANTVVVATNEYGALMSDGMFISYSGFRSRSGTDIVLKYGDVVDTTVVNDELFILACDPGRYADYNDVSFEYLGSVEYNDDYVSEKMTIVKIVDDGNFMLEDADGVVHNWYTPAIYQEFGYQVPEGLSYSDFRVGDVVTFAVEKENGAVILPLPPAPEP